MVGVDNRHRAATIESGERDWCVLYCPKSMTAYIFNHNGVGKHTFSNTFYGTKESVYSVTLTKSSVQVSAEAVLDPSKRLPNASLGSTARTNHAFPALLRPHDAYCPCQRCQRARGGTSGRESDDNRLIYSHIAVYK